jgi:hypothetical protein
MLLIRLGILDLLYLLRVLRVRVRVQRTPVHVSDFGLITP